MKALPEMCESVPGSGLGCTRPTWPIGEAAEPSALDPAGPPSGLSPTGPRPTTHAAPLIRAIRSMSNRVPGSVHS